MSKNRKRSKAAFSFYQDLTQGMLSCYTNNKTDKNTRV